MAKKPTPKIKIFISQKNNQVFTGLLNQKLSIRKKNVFQLSDLFVEDLDQPSLVGSIYKAKIIKRHIGLGAYFVDLGQGKSAFLYDRIGKDNQSLTLDEGKAHLVQVCKDRLGGKNPRVTTRISLPGRTIVYLPTIDSYVGISRQVTTSSKKNQLKESVSQWVGKDSLIIRTLGTKVKEEVLKKELQELKIQWEKIKEAYNNKKTKGLIWKDESLSHQVIRDFLTKETVEVGIDHLETFQKVKQFVASHIPEYKGEVKLYENTNLLSAYLLEESLDNLLEKKVRLRSGGFLIIEETSGGVIIDVNTGRSLAKKNVEHYLLKTNLDAAYEIARQLRLRNCGGIILIDFIDMQNPKFCEKVVNTLLKELEKDRSYTYVLPMSELGVVQMTRKRKRASLIETICKPCPTCHGRSYLKSFKKD